MRNICDACEHCVFTSKDLRFCMDHCDMVESIIANLEYARNKSKVSLYVDTDSVISKALDQDPRWTPVSEKLPSTDDEVLCWYEYYHWSLGKYYLSMD